MNGYPLNIEDIRTVPAAPLPEWQVAVDGIFIKQMTLYKAGTIVAQHTHVYDHHTMLATGRVRVWADDIHMGDFVAPCAILIRAGVAHKLMSLVDYTLAYCIHNLHGEDNVQILAEGV